MLGNMTVGHMFVGGGDSSRAPNIEGWVCSAPTTRSKTAATASLAYYDGENWNPELRAPLTQPGVNVGTGRVSAGRERARAARHRRHLQLLPGDGRQADRAQGGRRIPDGTGSREVTVVPVGSEKRLRHLAWIESTAARVDQLTGGRVAYVHLPDTAGGGYTNFNRYFFAQVGKEAVHSG